MRQRESSLGTSDQPPALPPSHQANTDSHQTSLPKSNQTGWILKLNQLRICLSLFKKNKTAQEGLVFVQMIRVFLRSSKVSFENKVYFGVLCSLHKTRVLNPTSSFLSPLVPSPWFLGAMFSSLCPSFVSFAVSPLLPVHKHWQLKPVPNTLP